MPRAPKRIHSGQRRGVYWPSWSPARKVLRANHYTPEECEDLRHEILKKQGVDSHKDLNNRQLDKCLEAHAAIADPRNGKRQAELADQPLKRVRWRIAKTASEIGYSPEKIEDISQRMFRRPIAQLTEAQLIKVSQALETHANRQKETP